MGALLTSVLIEQQVGIETVTHYCCRDRNLLGMLSDLLGASAMGLRNLLVITGDPPKMGPYPDATAVFDIDSIGLTNLVSNLNHGLDPGGNADRRADAFRDRRRRESGGDRSGARAQAVRVEGGSGRRVRDHAAGVRRRAARALPGADRARADPDHRGHLAARVRSQRRVSRERGARRRRAGERHRRGCARANEKSKEHAVAEGIAIAREMLESGARPPCRACRCRRRSGRWSWRSRCFASTPRPNVSSRAQRGAAHQPPSHALRRRRSMSITVSPFTAFTVCVASNDGCQSGVSVLTVSSTNSLGSRRTMRRSVTPQP